MSINQKALELAFAVEELALSGQSLLKLIGEAKELFRRDLIE